MPQPSSAVDPGPAGDRSAAGTPPTGDGWWRATVGPLAAHAACYLLLLGLVVGLSPEPSSFGTDDGAYGGQVHALLNGGWPLERALPVVDEANEGWLNSAITPDGPLPYTANPSWAQALTAAVRLGAALSGYGNPSRAADHPLALAALPLAGAVAAAATAWLLAARHHRRAGPVAFWLVALGPTLVNATTLWAHTVAAAAGGLTAAALAPVVAGRPGRSRLATGAFTALAALAAGGGAVVRTESMLWTGALALAAVAVARRPSVVLAAGSVAGVAGLAFLVNRGWGTDLRADRLPIITSVVELSESPGWLAGRLPAAYQLLATGGSAPVVVVAVLALALAVAGAVRLRTRPAGGASRPVSLSGPALLLMAALLYGVFALVGGSVTITGLLAAWPAGVVLLVAGEHRPDPPLRFLVVACGLFTVAVLATQYSSSGGHQWGGRYLSSMLAALAALAAVAGRRVWDEQRPVLVTLLLVPALAGAAASHRLHRTHHDVLAVLTDRGSEVVVTENPAVPRLAWTALPTTFYRADPDSLEPLLADLAAAGVETVTVHGVAGVEIGPGSGYRVVDTTPSLRHLQLITPSHGAPAAGP